MLRRRLLEDLADAERIYDPQKQKAWEKKYQFFSQPKMQASYRIYGQARCDPFNKDPSWGKIIIANVSAAFDSMGIDLHQVFAAARISDDTLLDRVQIKNALCNIISSLSDYEVQTIFDLIDEDGSGAVSVIELCNAIEEGRATVVPEEAAKRWRNPIHRIGRIPPATVEGWDHLVDAPEAPVRNLAEVSQEQLEQTFNNADLPMDAKYGSPNHLLQVLPKHHHFGGGGHTDRFERNRRARAHASGEVCDIEPSVPSMLEIGNSGLKPGFLCNSDNKEDMKALGFSAFSPRMQKPLRFQRTAADEYRIAGVF